MLQISVHPVIEQRRIAGGGIRTVREFYYESNDR
jgi:hypothetical protein